MISKNQIDLLQISLCLELMTCADNDPNALAKWANEQAALLEIRENLEDEVFLESLFVAVS